MGGQEIVKRGEASLQPAVRVASSLSCDRTLDKAACGVFLIQRLDRFPCPVAGDSPLHLSQTLSVTIFYVGAGGGVRPRDVLQTIIALLCGNPVLVCQQPLLFLEIYLNDLELNDAGSLRGGTLPEPSGMVCMNNVGEDGPGELAKDCPEHVSTFPGLWRLPRCHAALLHRTVIPRCSRSPGSRPVLSFRTLTRSGRCILENS